MEFIPDSRTDIVRHDWFVFVSLLATAACGGSASGPKTEPPDTPGTIGARGGVVTSADGAATLTVPAGALSTATAITLVPATNLPLDATLVGTAYQVLPASVSFSAPATLSIRYPDTGLPGGAIASDMAVGAIAGTAASLVNGSTRPAASTVAAPVSASGTFIAMWNPTGPCDEAQRRQFDFWVGRWRFESPGQPNGDETVVHAANGCGIRESFVQGTYRGSSISLFNTQQQRWHQTYVDTDRARRFLSGTFAGTSMTLNETPTIRYVWRVLTPTQVRFFEERSTDNGATWRETFVSTYTRIN